MLQPLPFWKRMLMHLKYQMPSFFKPSIQYRHRYGVFVSLSKIRGGMYLCHVLIGNPTDMDNSYVGLMPVIDPRDDMPVESLPLLDIDPTDEVKGILRNTLTMALVNMDMLVGASSLLKYRRVKILSLSRLSPDNVPTRHITKTVNRILENELKDYLTFVKNTNVWVDITESVCLMDELIRIRMQIPYR